MEKSLLVRVPNWVGDVVMALPALQAMMNSGLHLEIYGKPWVQSLCAGMSFSFTPMEKTWATCKHMQANNAKKALLLTNSFSSAWLAFWAGKATIGYQSDLRRFLMTASLEKTHQHEVLSFWTLASFAMHYWYPHLLWPDRPPERISLPLCENAKQRIDTLLQSKGLTAPFWVLCPFAHGKGKEGASKIWPSWPLLSKYLSLQKHSLIVCPGRGEEALCAQLVPEAVVLSGLNLADYAALLAKAEQVIANDSGPMHMAAACDVPTLGLFGVSSPELSSPWGASYLGTLGQWPSLDAVIEKLAVK